MKFNKITTLKITFPISLGCIMLLSTGCATDAYRYVMGTPYQAEKESYGLSVSRLNPDYQAFLKATFKGNQYTDKKDAELYAQLHAIEYCMEQNKLSFLTEVEDRTFQMSWTQVSSTTTYSTNSSGNLVPTTNVSSYPVMLEYPRYNADFTCMDKFRVLDHTEIELNQIPAEQTLHLVNDFKGGLGVVNESQKLSVLKTGDLITHINKRRITGFAEYTEVLVGLKDSKTVDIVVIRNLKPIHLKVPVVDTTEQMSSFFVDRVVDICTNLTNRRAEMLNHSKDGLFPSKKSVEDFSSPFVNVCDKMAHFLEKSPYISK